MERTFPKSKEHSDNVFHLSPKVGGAKQGNLQILGIAHGSGRQLIPKDSADYISGHFSDYGGKIFVEGAPEYFVPGHLAGRSEVIEPLQVYLTGGKFFKKIEAESNGKFAQMDSKAFREHLDSITSHWVEPPGSSSARLTKAQQRSGRTLYAVSRQVSRTSPEIGFLLDFRNAIMAGELLRRTRHGRDPALLVVGSFHANRIHQFLENPRLAARYLSFADHKFAQMEKAAQSWAEKNELEALRSYLSRAKRAFEKQAKMAG